MKGVRKVQQAMKRNRNVNSIKKAICGELLGVGCFRDVYVLKQNPDYVVKIERDPSRGMFCNVTEWSFYVNNRGIKFMNNWLAECELITETGQVMVQRRVVHKQRKEYPKYVPDIFTDIKLTNFGWIGDRFVCCDYAFTKFFAKKKMKCAKWRGSVKHLPYEKK